jgi:hypothetical protein
MLTHLEIYPGHTTSISVIFLVLLFFLEEGILHKGLLKIRDKLCFFPRKKSLYSRGMNIHVVV